MIVLLALLALLVPAAAEAQTTTVRAQRGDLRTLPPGDAVPAGRRLRPSAVVRIAAAVPAVRAARAAAGRTYARAYLAGSADWQISFYASRDREEIAQVRVADASRRVLEAWTGVQVAWAMARGQPGAFGRSANHPVVWAGLCLAFLLPFLRRPLRLVHLDLAVLLAFSASYAWFNDAELGLSVPSAYPLLLYLLARALAVGMRPGRRAPPLRARLGTDALAVGLLFLIGFRIALNVTDGNVIDVGYAGVIGADRLAGGDPLYGSFPPDNPRGDTYGPVVYAAYVPFEAVLPWSGRWDGLPAAHAAAVAFDLAATALCFLLGRAVRGTGLGLLLAYLWVAFPFTLLVVNSGANDALVTVLVSAALLLAARPLARGAVLAAAGLTKFAPLALAPLLLTYRAGPRAVLLSVAGFVAVVLLALSPFAGVLDVAWERTLGFQDGRDSPFSLWGWYGGLDGLQRAVQLAAVGLALLVAVVPRRRDPVTLAALSAAVLIALQLAVTHWFYLYLVWFLPPLWVALLGREPAEA